MAETRARDTADVVADVPVLASGLSNRNLLYNGAMQVAQRGTSAAGITSYGYYTADRWNCLTGAGTWTQTLENDAPTGSGLRKSLKMLCTTASASLASSEQIRVTQMLEGQDLQRIAKGTASAQQLTVSFWVKSNNTGTYTVALSDLDNTRLVSAQYTITASATWERKTITFPADTAGIFDNDNQGSLYLLFYLGLGSNFTSGTLASTWEATVQANIGPGQTNLAAATSNYWQITGVQLEVGPTATGFEFKSFGQELAECQRYYQKSYNYEVVPGSASTGYIVIAGMANSSTTTGNNNVGFRFASRMRTTPTVTAYNYSGTINSIHYARHSTPANTAPASVTRTSDAGSCIYTAGASGLTIGYAVEIIFHYTASAEL